jgi:NADH dehydrogenase FAD-containing subunit
LINRKIKKTRIVIAGGGFAGLCAANLLWDPLRADPAFQKLCEEKQP